MTYSHFSVIFDTSDFEFLSQLLLNSSASSLNIRYIISAASREQSWERHATGAGEIKLL
jgi:hypothetical protein